MQPAVTTDAQLSEVGKGGECGRGELSREVVQLQTKATKLYAPRKGKGELRGREEKSREQQRGMKGQKSESMKGRKRKARTWKESLAPDPRTS